MMFNLILIFLVLNLAVIIRELTGSHPIRARCASRLHLQCGRQSPQCVLNTKVFLRWSDSYILSQLPCLTQSRETIAFATFSVLPAFCIVLMFHVASLMVFLGVRIEVSPASSFRLLFNIIIFPWSRPNMVVQDTLGWFSLLLMLLWLGFL